MVTPRRVGSLVMCGGASYLRADELNTALLKNWKLLG